MSSFLTGWSARTIMMISETASVLKINYISKRYNAILSFLSPNLTFEHRMELRNALVYLVKEFLLLNIILQVVEKSSNVLRDEAIRKMVSFKSQLSRPLDSRELQSLSCPSTIVWRHPPVPKLQPGM